MMGKDEALNAMLDSGSGTTTTIRDLMEHLKGCGVDDVMYRCSKCGSIVKAERFARLSGGKIKTSCKSCDNERRAAQRRAAQRRAGSEASTQGESWSDRVERHHAALKRRGGVPRSAEMDAPTGQALGWYMDVAKLAPPTGRDVARQLARLCGEDSVVTISERSLADAVGLTDSEGRARSYVESGIKALVKAEWLEVEHGEGGQPNVYRLMPGPLDVPMNDVLIEHDMATWQPLASDDHSIGEPANDPGLGPAGSHPWAHTEADEWALSAGLPARCSCHS